MSSSPSEGGTSRIRSHYTETGNAIFGGMADVTYRNLWGEKGQPGYGLLGDVAKGAGNTIFGLPIEIFKGLFKGGSELVKLHPGNAVLETMRGVREGITRVFRGLYGGTVGATINTTRKALDGVFRVTGGITGLIGLGGDIKALPATAPSPAPA